MRGKKLNRDIEQEREREIESTRTNSEHLSQTRKHERTGMIDDKTICRIRFIGLADDEPNGSNQKRKKKKPNISYGYRTTRKQTIFAILYSHAIQFKTAKQQLS